MVYGGIAATCRNGMGFVRHTLEDDSMNFLQDYTAISLLVGAALLMVAMYFGRHPAQHAIISASRVAHNALRLSARAVKSTEALLRQRNRDVLLARGELEAETELEREFQRIQTILSRDLAGFPALQRKIADLVERVDVDYQSTVDVPPAPTAWVKAVETVAGLEDCAKDRMAGNVLGEIHKTLKRQQKEVLDDYRKQSARRHALLHRMAPRWRELSGYLRDVGRTVAGLPERAAMADRRMEEYEQIRRQSDKSLHKLSSSAMTQFFISLLVLLIAMGGAVINFNLIALPMSEMVGGGSYLGPFKTSNVAAMVIILVEAAMGLFLMEALRITRLFPLITMMDDRMRRRLGWIAFALLLTLAGVESALAFMRDRIAADNEALRQTLSGAEHLVRTGAYAWIPTAGQMVLGFILPFALTFVAIPLESFIHSARTVTGMILLGLVQITAWLLRVLGSLCLTLGKLTVALYDVLIFFPLWIECRLLVCKESRYVRIEPAVPASIGEGDDERDVFETCGAPSLTDSDGATKSA